MTSPALLRLCLVDMNNGVPNQAIRCFRRIIEHFEIRLRAAAPKVKLELEHVQPRNLGELPRKDADLVLSSGGPGAPTDGYEDAWCTGYRRFLDRVKEQNLAHPATAPKALLVCHSFEIAVLHFGLAAMRPRSATRFGVMPVYLTDEGRSADYLHPFEDRLFAWEHRNWEAVDLDERALAGLGGSVLARESRPHGPDKGQALLGLDFGEGLSGTQYHPEADRPGVMAWIDRPEHALAFQRAYGVELYDRMKKSLDDPSRLARTFALLIPGWLTCRYNELARERGLPLLAAPEADAREFEAA